LLRPQIRGFAWKVTPLRADYSQLNASCERVPQRMILIRRAALAQSVKRFSEKIMPKQEAKARQRKSHFKRPRLRGGRPGPVAHRRRGFDRFASDRPRPALDAPAAPDLSVAIDVAPVQRDAPAAGGLRPDDLDPAESGPADLSPGGVPPVARRPGGWLPQAAPGGCAP